MNIPQRTCIVCRDVGSKKSLIRIVKVNENDIELDLTGRKNGRGAYICRNPECFKNLKKKGALERSFKMSISSEIYDRLTDELTSLGDC